MAQVVNPLQPGVAKVTQPGAGSSYSTPAPKTPPAPGQSPQGGTTSLPQHLQTPTPPAIPGMGPTSSPNGAGSGNPYSVGGANGTGMPPGTAPIQPVPSSTPPGTVPPPPPVAPPAPAAPPAVSVDPGAVDQTGGHNKEMGDKLFQVLMEQLNNPSRYGAAEAQATRTQGYQKLDDERKLAEDKAKSDAAARGVYYGSPLTNSLGDIGERYLRGGSDLETNIQRDQAQHFQEDRMSAINAIFGYGNQQRLDQQQQQDLWTKLLELGYVGGPQMPGNTGLPLPPTGA